MVESSPQSTVNVDSNTSEKWQGFLENFKETVGYFQYKIFGSNIELDEITSDEIRLQVPREFHKTWLEDKQNEALTNARDEAFDEDKAIRITISNHANSPSSEKNGENKTQPDDLENVNREFPFAKSNQFDNEFTFDNFVVGDSNEYAYTAAQAITDDPANSFNPLFVYGGVGLGKTHLLQAIGNKVKSQWEQANVMCINAEKFTNQIINAIREGTTKDFKYRYRNVDMFLVDDVQFLSKTDAAQEEFYHTFNELYEKGKGTVFCSDCPPREIPKIEDRLRSRFGMGLIVDIKPPDYETRVAILQKKAEQENLEVSPDVIEFIASHIQSNVRELESSLTRIAMKASLSKEPITVDLAQDELSNIIQHENREEVSVVTVDEIQKHVAEHFNISIGDLKSKRRTRSITEPRQIAMFLAREKTNQSYSEIGEMFGGRDHSTVIHAENKITDALDDNTEPEITSHISKLRDDL